MLPLARSASLLLPMTAFVAAPASSQSLDVGSLRSDRIHDPAFEFATGSYFADARAELLTPAQFGPGGTVNATFTIQPATFGITSATLAGIEIFFAAMLDNTQPLSPVEQQDLYDFVVGGGALVIVADVGPFSIGPNSIAAPFGLVWSTSAWLDENPIVTDAMHPIISGPFGTVTTIGHASQGAIDQLGLLATEIASNTQSSSIAGIAPGALGPCSGPVLFFSDVNEFANNSTPWGPGLDQGDNRVLFRNLFAHLASPACGGIGVRYCSPAIVNSTGFPGVISASGSDIASANDVTLVASGLPLNSFGYFLNSMAQGNIAFPGGSQGRLCLAGGIGRYSQSTFFTGMGGSGNLVLDLVDTPTPVGPTSIVAGQAWNFQAWYRDANPGSTSNFTDAVSIVFQ